jgi:hypothetical protein
MLAAEQRRRLFRTDNMIRAARVQHRIYDGLRKEGLKELLNTLRESARLIAARADRGRCIRGGGFGRPFFILADVG